MCYFALDLKKEPYVVMGTGLFRKIAADVFPKAVQVNLSCAAEPLLIPDFPEYLAITKEYNIPTTVLVTNAFFLNEKIVCALIDAGITYIDISIDGATKKTYESIRKGSDFYRVLANVVMLQDIKKKMGSKNPLLYLDYALMKCNIHEFPDFLRLASKLGADRIRANHLIPFKHLNIMAESLAGCKEETNRVFDEARAVAKELKLDVCMPPNFITGNAAKEEQAILNKKACRAPFDSMFIVSDGKVIPCTWFSFKKWAAGDFRKENFYEIWNGAVYKKLRTSFRTGEYTEYCFNCPVYGDETMDDYVFAEREREDVINISSTPV
jgi:radical SAM protein with 4Fe4S-binding SPASM domain